jgi:hypothetical protein
LEKTYIGEEVIRKQLMFVSDVVRLCVMLGIAFHEIFLDFINCLKFSQNLPRVLVTFTSIVHEPETLGKVSIIDMPGPDERGLSDILNITVETVLVESSAVALVIPYDTLDSYHHDSIHRVVSAVN